VTRSQETSEVDSVLDEMQQHQDASSVCAAVVTVLVRMGEANEERCQEIVDANSSRAR
jgi:hypothetical protein